MAALAGRARPLPPARPACRASSRQPSSQRAAIAESSAAPPIRRAKRALEAPEERARRARPQGWTPPGPAPVGAAAANEPPPDLLPVPGETLSYLSGDWRIFQLADGHRWSIDDHVTALVALEEAARLLEERATSAAGDRRGERASSSASQAPPPPLRTLDLGCGIGSVLLMTAWGLLTAASGGEQQQRQQQQQQKQQQRQVCAGVEAQAVSASLARRSAAYNLGSGGDVSGEGSSPGARVVVVEGDLRDPAVRRRAAGEAAALGGGGGSGATTAFFDLITGTPPYIPVGSGALSARPQKGACCVETRGGVEEYCLAAAELLAPGGVFVCCAGVTPDDSRARKAAREAGLAVRRRVVVVPRRGKPPLFEVLVMERAEAAATEDGGEEGGAKEAAQDDEDEVFVVREADGSLSPQMHAARAAMGMPPARGAPPAVAAAAAAPCC